MSTFVVSSGGSVPNSPRCSGPTSVSRALGLEPKTCHRLATWGGHPPRHRGVHQAEVPATITGEQARAANGCAGEQHEATDREQPNGRRAHLRTEAVGSGGTAERRASSNIALCAQQYTVPLSSSTPQTPASLVPMARSGMSPTSAAGDSGPPPVENGGGPHQ